MDANGLPLTEPDLSKALDKFKADWNWDNNTNTWAGWRIEPFKTVSYIVNEGGSIKGIATQRIAIGENTAEVEAVPSDGYRFIRWSDGVKTAKRSESNVQQDWYVEAIFELIPTYTLTYTAGVGGSISGQTTQTVREGQSGTEVEAVADDGYRFAKWNDDVFTAKRTHSNVQRDWHVTAIFDLIPAYTLTYTAGEGGSISGQATQTVRQGLNGSEVEAVPNEGYRFVKWSDGVKTAKRFESNVQQDWNIDAIFELIPTYTLTYTAGEGGSISGQATQIVQQGKNGTEVEAKPNGGYKFVKWSDDLTTAKRIDKNVQKDLEIAAIFELIPTSALTYIAGDGGSIRGQASQTVQQGQSGTEVEAVPNAGYRFVKWSDGNTNAKRTESNVTANISVTAEFEVIIYTLNYTAGENGSIQGQTTQTVQHGQSGEEVVAVPNDGYRFVKWSDGVATAKRTDSNVQANLSVTAEFEKSNTTDLFDVKRESLSVFPNPTQGVLWVSVPELAEGTAAEMHVYNTSGQLLQRVPAHGASACSAASRLSIDLSGYPAGVYIIRVGNAVAKVVKQ